MNKGETLTLASATFGDVGILDTHSTVGTGNPLITLPNATFGAIALLTAAFIILVVWRRRQNTRSDGRPTNQV